MRALRRAETVEIYPRERTETVILFCKPDVAPVEIYPREGTETSFHLELIF